MAASSKSPIPVEPAPLCPPASEQSEHAAVPHYDPVARVLWAGALVVKRFGQPARSQELILQALEEQGWPYAVDDPLPPKSRCNPKQRLHDTIQNLNRNQQHALIHFFGDGSGQRVGWEWRRRATPELHQR
jgi:hypothetical protein